MDVRIVDEERRINVSTSSIFINHDQIGNIMMTNNNSNHQQHQHYQNSNNNNQHMIGGIGTSNLNGLSANNGGMKAGVVLRTRVELPQFDFHGLPQIPPSSSYAKRLSDIKQYGPNTFVLNKTEKPPSAGTRGEMVYQYTTESIAKRQLIQEREQITLPNIRSRESTKSAQSLGKPVQRLNRQMVIRLAHAETEEEVLECLASDKDLEGVQQEDMEVFRNLYFLDVSGNYIPFEQLASLPSLKNLNIGCNALSGISIPQHVDNAFSKLEILNLSYNTFSDPYLFNELGKLKQLRKLDLSGNNLQGLPNDLSQFSLTEIILEDNVLDFSVFYSLSSMPSLVEISLNKNNIEKIPKIRKEIFPNLLRLRLEENQITTHEDLYVNEFSCLETLYISSNPISNRSKDLERARYTCNKRNIRIIISGLIMPSEKLPVTKFYKLNSMINVNSINKKSQPPATREKEMDTTKEEDTESSFFITAVPRLDLKAVAEKEPTSEKILTPTSPFRSPTTKLFTTQSASEIKKITESYDRMNDIGKKVKVTYDVKDLRKSSRMPADRYEYNKDWFDLDVALNNVDESLDEEIKKNASMISQEKQKLALYNDSVDLYKTNLTDKKNTYRALKFAIENPIKLPFAATRESTSDATKTSLDVSALKSLYS
ncbi:hypothetical protein C9374_008740 [Naegleria lovaniensis]|uniref:Leucine-rich repeat-containing protein n=1 Tax=Naegleria lovaniensis TaxID=51637 RepID=A0AA88KHR9_NAELO|nr:uncharacterized protein C9374_008740 [Naegleria lovaniensis]KAG2378118.1 hypothetical protein C9374_008740 [Naegleria lovaniensis]